LSQQKLKSGRFGSADKSVNLGRHKTACMVCKHPHCADIESEFVAWKSPATIATEFGLADRASVRRHAEAFGLRAKRQKNLKVALERMIEKAGDVDVTAFAVVQAIQAYAKINAAGQWVERTEQVNLNDLFERMSISELETYARDGTLPGWFEASAVGAQQGGSVRDDEE
jgi:hypothetical protein